MIRSEWGTFHDREDDAMPRRDEMPYDFSQLDDLYLTADNFYGIASFMCDDLVVLHEKAWSDSDAQTPDDVDAYLRKYVIASWRDLELRYIQEAEIGRERTSSFRTAVIGFGTLLNGESMDEDLLAVVSLYQRDVFLQKMSELSALWLEKYGVELEYDSEVQFGYSDWKIVVLPKRI